MPSAADISASLNRLHGTGAAVIGQAGRAAPHLATGVWPLDIRLNGGWTQGQMHCLCGW